MKLAKIGDRLTHGSLFSGIGGFDLASEWMGWENVFHCEINNKLRSYLQYYWSNAESYGDITQTDFTIWRGRIDIITGGDPCQPHSHAGLGRGKADNRYLWPEMFRSIRESEPPWVVNENVYGSISNGILDIKIDDLESLGYEAQSYCIPAEAVGALHQRERVWIVAFNSDYYGKHRKPGKNESQGKKEKLQERDKVQFFGEPVNLWDYTTNPNSERFKKQHNAEKSKVLPEGLSRYFGFGIDPHGDIPKDIIESAIMGMLNGLPEGMDYTNRNQRIKGLGNAIVPQIAFEIFKAIQAIISHLGVIPSQWNQ